MTVKEWEDFLFTWAPKELAADWDNVGHLVGDNHEVKKILISLDITEKVVEEAVTLGADLIISHHPVMNCTWHPVQTVNNDNSQGRAICRMIKNGISAICMHTNLDAAQGGVNDILAKTLGLKNVELLNCEKIGRVGSTNCEIPLVEFVSFVVKSLKCNGARYTDSGKTVHRVAVGGGACGEYISDAIAAGCDTFVTSDLKYHEFLDATQINLIDAGHFPTENVICEEISRRIQQAYPTTEVIISTVHRCEVIQYCIKEK